MKQASKGILARYAVRHPVGIVSITLAVMVLGLAAFFQLNTNLLPDIIYPEIRIRVMLPGTPPGVMEDQVTRQLEEQLAITENATNVQSRTREGRSSVDLSFEYGTDIDVALRDASTRLDRAKRFLPDGIDPPVIYKRDPSQRPVAEYVISSTEMDPVSLRDWVEYQLSKRIINLPGVASTEVGGGSSREIQIQMDLARLSALKLDPEKIATALQSAHRDEPIGELVTEDQTMTVRLAGRLDDIQSFSELPVVVTSETDVPRLTTLSELADIRDGAEPTKLLIRLNGNAGIKLSIQKQPQANTIRVVNAIKQRIQQLRDNQLIPPGIEISEVADEAKIIQISVDNAALAAVSGALLAMLVVYLFLGDWRRTLIIGSAIPIAVLVTFTLMSVYDLTLNVMTLGGLALGVGMLVDNTIVMLENIQRHQAMTENTHEAAIAAASEVNSAIIASTSTNLAAVLPFLFVGGLIGLLFKSLIITISSAILASLFVALTLVPALASRIRHRTTSRAGKGEHRLMESLARNYATTLAPVLRKPVIVLGLFLLVLFTVVPGYWMNANQIFLPSVDEGRVDINITSDRGTTLAQTNDIVRKIEKLLAQRGDAATVFSQVGGFVFGRSEFESPNRASITVILKPQPEREVTTAQWIKEVRQQIKALQLVGTRVRMRARGLRGIRLNQGSDDLSLMIQGPDHDVLEQLAEPIIQQLEAISGLRNIKSSNEDQQLELQLSIDRIRARDYGLSASDIAHVLRAAVDGTIITELIEDDRSIPIRLTLRADEVQYGSDLTSLIIFSRDGQNRPLRLGEIADISLVPVPATLIRDQQQRVIEISASISRDADMADIDKRIKEIIAQVELPANYYIYEAGSLHNLQAAQNTGYLLLGLALFLVFVVMAVQYESVLNPLVIIFSVPFAVIGVITGLNISGLPLSMPVWLGLIMLGGIVVNNAIILVEYIEQQRTKGLDIPDAITAAARLRLRPILMTTLTTVMGMLPLALALSQGAELLQPLAVTIMSGLLFSLLVSLYLVPAVYTLAHRIHR